MLHFLEVLCIVFGRCTWEFKGCLVVCSFMFVKMTKMTSIMQLLVFILHISHFILVSYCFSSSSLETIIQLISSICFMIFMAQNSPKFHLSTLGAMLLLGGWKKQENWWVDYHFYVYINQGSPFFLYLQTHHLRFFGNFPGPLKKKSKHHPKHGGKIVPGCLWWIYGKPGSGPKIESLLGGGFNYFSIFTPTLGKIPILD